MTGRIPRLLFLVSLSAISSGMSSFAEVAKGKSNLVFFWRIDEVDAEAGERRGLLWRFTTRTNQPLLAVGD